MTAKKKHQLTEALEQVCRVLKGKPSDWYVQSDERDPYYIVASPANIRDAEWMKLQLEERGIADPTYPRGTHYSCLGADMPDDPPLRRVKTKNKHGVVIDYRLPEWDHRYAVYENTQWHADFSENALKVGPWVGAFPFSRVFEKRNRNGIKRIVVPQDAPEGWIDQLGADDQVIDLRGIELPTAEELRPSAGLRNFFGRADDAIPGIFKGSPYCPQCFQIVIVGEKTSLEPILRLIAEMYDAHLFLASGDLTNPLVYDIARVGGELDLRPMIILYFTDSDPAGSTMPVVLAWKLRALKELWFPNLTGQIHRVGLLPSQVKAFKARADEDPDWHRLHESPLKDGETRKDAWFAETGTYQTEIDSLITFHPEELEAMAHKAIGHFFDPTLNQRVIDLYSEYTQRQLDAADELDDKSAEREAAAARMAELQQVIAEATAEIEELSATTKIDLSGLELEDPPEKPESELDEDAMPEPLIDLDWPFAMQVKLLHEAKHFRR